MLSNPIDKSSNRNVKLLTTKIIGDFGESNFTGTIIKTTVDWGVRRGWECRDK